MQEAFLRAWKSFEQFEGRSSLRSWLYSIVTNVCLDMLGGRERRARPMELAPARSADTPLPDPLPDVDPARARRSSGAPERRPLRGARGARVDPPRVRGRAAAPAAAAACGADPPRGPALEGFEVAELLDTSVASVNSALQRARDPRVPRDRGSRDPATHRRRAARAARPLRRCVRAVRHGVAHLAPARGRHVVDAAVRDVAADPRRHPSMVPGAGDRLPGFETPRDRGERHAGVRAIQAERGEGSSRGHCRSWRSPTVGSPGSASSSTRSACSRSSGSPTSRRLTRPPRRRRSEPRADPSAPAGPRAPRRRSGARPCTRRAGRSAGAERARRP